MVFNRRTYPNLTRFFEHLGVDAADADMSFSVSVADEDIEWSGTSLDTVFAQRKNIANPRFLQMLTDVLRLSRNADRLMADPSVADMTLGELMAREGYSKAFTDWYLIPMGDAIWSTPPGDMMDYPALTFLHFCDNHGLLHILGKPAWLSVKGGSEATSTPWAKTLSGEVFVGEGAERVEDCDRRPCPHPPQGRGVRRGRSGKSSAPDAWILGDWMSPAEREVLSAFEYWPNDVVVHTDESFLPRSKRAWASWNWYSEGTEIDKAMLRLTYRINTLQTLPASAPSVLETLNRDREPADGTMLAHLSFDHPMYSRAAVAAQSALPESRVSTASGSPARGRATASTRTASFQACA